MSTWTSKLAQRPHDAQHVRRRLLRERDDDALDVEQRDELREASGVPRTLQVLELGAALLRLRVDEADEVDAVLRVLEDLAAEQLADVTGADDDAVLDVREAEAGGRARDDAAERSRTRARSTQKSAVFVRVGVHDAGCGADDPERPRRHRDQVEDADDVVGGRVLGALLVVVVEAVEPREDDPGRQRQEEDGELGRRRDALAGRRRRGPPSRANASVSPTRSATSSSRRISAPRLRNGRARRR